MVDFRTIKYAWGTLRIRKGTGTYVVPSYVLLIRGSSIPRGRGEAVAIEPTTVVTSTVVLRRVCVVLPYVLSCPLRTDYLYLIFFTTTMMIQQLLRSYVYSALLLITASLLSSVYAYGM